MASDMDPTQLATAMSQLAQSPILLLLLLSLLLAPCSLLLANILELLSTLSFSSTVEDMLKYIYGGKIENLEDKASKLLAAADQYDLKYLKKR